MSLWSRIANVFRAEGPSREIDEELQSHITEALEHGRDSAEVRRSFGSPVHHAEQSRDVRLFTWLDSLRADTVFGWRQLSKKKITSAAAILSLGFAIGSCTSAFRLIEALLLRPLPVANPESLYAISFEGITDDGQPDLYDSCSYPMFRQWRAAVKDRAELIAMSYAERVDLTYTSDLAMEKAYRQYVSGWMFGTFGLRPVLGRLLTEKDDITPGAHPNAVLSYDYWSHRFGQDPHAIGRTFRMDNDLYEIVGVTPEGFTGTEPGTMPDIFVPTMMNVGSVNRSNSFWFRTFVQLKPGIALEPLRDELYATYRAFEQERAKTFTNFPKHLLEGFPRDKLLVTPAVAGVSELQNDYRRSLAMLSMLVALVLFIASANVANLLAAQATWREKEMALRVSIGAGRRRLVQLVLVESALLAFIAATIGALFAWWSAPFVVGMINSPEDPARLALRTDWRVLGFGIALTFLVTLLFGLGPALHASGVQPAGTLKGGADPHARRRGMHALIVLQVAFCFLVLFFSGLFVATFNRLSHQPTGFSSERLLNLEIVAQPGQSPVSWDQVAEHLRAVPGVEKVALADWPLLSGAMSNNFISIHGAPASDVLTFFLGISPGWTETMRIPLLNGRDFRGSDIHPSVVIVNQTFARQYFGGDDPVGKSFETIASTGKRVRFQIVGLAGDARYQKLRESMLPVAYVPFQSAGANGAFEAKWRGTFIVRTSRSNPLALASILRQEVPRAKSGFRVTNIRTQQEINESHTVRERLLAMLALFFSVVALLLAGIGLYGVLDFSVLQRRREIGIRMALGARAGHVVGRVTLDVFSMMLLGAIAGIAIGLGCGRYIQSMLYEVKPTDWSGLGLPALAILAAGLIAALPAVIRAVRINPANILRSE